MSDETNSGKSIDPEVAEYFANRKRRWGELEAKLRMLEQPLLADIRHVGVDVGSVNDLINLRDIGPAAVDVMMSWITRLGDHRLQGIVIRSLTAAAKPFDATPLISLFENDIDERLRWPIAIAMTSSKAKGLSNWLRNAVKNKTYGSDRQMLIIALVKHVSQDVALPVLYSIFDELPGHVPEAMGLIGGVNELAFLRSQVDTLDGWRRKEAEKAIRKIEHRTSGRDRKRGGTG